jgi:hypothetical protein
MLGITFNVAAAFDRWKMDDPYPGYGELARRREALESEYICQKQEVENYLAEIKDNALTAVAALSSEIEALKEEHRAIVLSRTNLIERFRGHMQYLEQCGNELLTVYRRANSSRRSTPPPSHFHCKWRLPQIAYSLQSGKVPKIEADTLVENVREVRTTIIEAFRKSMDEFHTIEALGRGGAN